MFRVHQKSTGAGFLLCAALAASTICAGDLSSYRGLQFGMSVPSAAKEAGAKTTDVVIVHQRPALIQDMEWRPRPSILTDAAKADPVKEGSLSFFNGELFRIVVVYDRYKIEGMTEDDMIEALSRAYGAPTRPMVEIAYHSNFAEVASVVARWENAEYSYNLVRSGDRSSFAMVLYSKRLDALAQAAIVQAVKIETQEAPQRELDKQKKRDDDERIALEKARSANKLNFRP